MTHAPVLDWRPRHDPRSRDFPVRGAILDEDAQVSRARRMLWRPGPILNQGSEGACVGHAIVDDATAEPVAVHLPDPQAEAFAVYRDAQLVDEYPGEAYDGTSVNAGAKVARSRGWWQAYRWCFGIDDVVDTILEHGPVVIGIPWYAGMYSAPGGRVTVSGSLVGGHCLLATGYDFRDGVQLTNSWGTSWGTNGQAWIDAEVLAGLLDQNGEACTPDHRLAPSVEAAA